jgi:hypothetical protein
MITDNNQCRKVNITEFQGYKICYSRKVGKPIYESKGTITFKL